MIFCLVFAERIGSRSRTEPCEYPCLQRCVFFTREVRHGIEPEVEWPCRYGSPDWRALCHFEEDGWYHRRRGTSAKALSSPLDATPVLGRPE